MLRYRVQIEYGEHTEERSEELQEGFLYWNKTLTFEWYF